MNDVACEGGAADVALSKVESEAACIDANLTNVVFSSQAVYPYLRKLEQNLKQLLPK